MQRDQRQMKGLTLRQLLVVIIIIGLLLGVISVSF
jgi:Tfp pilus assembly protein PilE